MRNKLIFTVLSLFCSFCLNVDKIEANSNTLSIYYPDGYTTGRMIYASGWGNVCEDGKDHRLLKVGGVEKFLGLLTLDGNVVFCVEPFVSTKTGYQYISSSMQSLNISEELKNEMELVSYFGYGYNNDYSQLARVATQIAIWEVQGLKVEDISAIVRNYVEMIKNRVINFKNKTIPSFCEKTFVFKGYGKAYAIELINQNKDELSWFINHVDENLNYEITEEKISVWADKPFEDIKNISFSLYDPNDVRISGNSIVYIHPNNAQKLVKFADPVGREVDAKFVMASGDVIIQKYKNESINTSSAQLPEEGAEFILMKKTYVDQYGGIEEAYAHRTSFFDSEYDYLITNKEGVAKSKKLSAGTYLIKQVKGEKDTVLHPSLVSVVIENENQSTQYISITNLRYSSKLKVVKMDEEKNEITNSRMHFKIKDESGNYVQIEKDGKLIDEWYTDENGSITLPFDLEAGHYTLLETKAPDGFYLQEREIPFVITNEDKVLEEDPILVLEVVNKKLKGKIVIHKTFENSNYLVGEGVIFELFANSDIINPTNGTLLFKKGTSLGFYKTLKNGVLEIDNLPLSNGKVSYKLKEIQTYENYQLDTKEYVFEFDQVNQKVEEIIESKEIENKLITINTLAKDKLNNSKTVDAVKEITIMDTISYEGLRINQKYFIKSYLVDKFSGNIIKDINGKYISQITEFISKNSKGQICVELSFDASSLGEKQVVVFEEIYNEDNELVAFHKDLNAFEQTIFFRSVYDVEIEKVDSQNNQLIYEPFQFAIYKDKTCKEEIKRVLGVGSVKFLGLTYGTWYIKEVVPPIGYSKSDKTIKIHIDENGIYINDEKSEDKENIILSFKNDKIPPISTNTYKTYILEISSMIMLLISGLVLILLKNK